MTPHVRYARTTDGVDIAFWTVGEGVPLLYLPRPGFSHIQQEWEYPEMRAWYERLARDRTVIRYDARGTGLSARGVMDFSLEAHSLDIDAVVGCLGLDQLGMWAVTLCGPVAIRYAFDHPELVSHLFLWCTSSQGAAIRGARGPALRALLDADWVLYTEAVAHNMLGWKQADDAQHFAEFMRTGVTQEVMQAFMREAELFDVSALLMGVRARTAVMQRREVPWPDLSEARALATGIPDAQLILLEGNSIAPFLGDMESVARAMGSFDGVGLTTDMVRPQHERGEVAGAAVILFTDIVSSTELTERMGDARFRDASRRIDDDVRAAIRAAGGTPVAGKVLGDGVMGVFASAAQAIRAAQRCVEASSDLPMHIGLHAGDVIREGDNVYGGAVNIASRICGLCEPGEILVSATVRDLARTSAGVTFEDRGEHALKGIADPVRVFAVRPGQ